MTPAPGARGRQCARRSRSLPRGERDAEPRRALRLFLPPRPRPISAPQDRLSSLTSALRVALLHPPVQRGDPAIARRLIEYRVTFGGEREGLGVALLLCFEGIEARAQ